MKIQGIFLNILKLCIVLVFNWSCKTTGNSTKGNEIGSALEKPVLVDQKPYKNSATKFHNLIHTRLEVSFDWANRKLMGEAEITLKPHSKPTNQLFLDAKGMDIKEVKIIKGVTKAEVAYTYRNDSICITLDKFYTNRDTFKIYVDYIANPETLPKGGSAAITSDKGLYFINHDNSDQTKPQQIWTQGETQSSSVWFPTLDRPNQKTTQEIYITVDTSFVTLSNGLLISSIVNASTGSRTDYWKQEYPHAPYLFMMAIGKFAVVKDTWRNKEVSYYVDPEYEPYAREIFDHTPEMLEFFSKQLGVEYAWEKYAQVIVKDYVSGAMENTSATIFGDFVQKDSRELLDGNNDDIVSHELYHHWFGDLVTCESWSNLLLNESFATYAEYLWFEYKEGRDQADYAGQNDLNSYLREAKNKQVDLIRFDYQKQEDMFDNHTYAKGGRVLHMLRKYCGDESFFRSLKLYLDRNRFKSAEIHDLRLAFEEVTGEDLNWFFNQWFLDKGHPSLVINYLFDEVNSKQLVTIEQTQNLETTPLYKIPVDVDVYADQGVQRERITISKQKETFSFDVTSKPQLVNFDAQKMILGTKIDNHSDNEWMYLFTHGPLYLDRYEPLFKFSKPYLAGSPESELFKKALSDPFWNIRLFAVKNCNPLLKTANSEIKQIVMALASNDPDPSVREEALVALSDNFKNDDEVRKIIKNAINDSSYMVMGTAIMLTVEDDKNEGLKIVKAFENDNNKNVTEIVADTYTAYGSDEQYDFMTNALRNAKGVRKYSAVRGYGKFLLRCKPPVSTQGLDNIAEIGKNYPSWVVRLAATQSLSEIAKSYGKKSAGTEDVPANQVLKDREEIENGNVRKRADDLLTQIKSAEKDERLIKIYGQ
ncbi:MAG: HEAT repeat domain-containing protein [Bacteroidetes bacterium]|nr:HEAT repeat domain-containing protein [Bacteroidota bacterium]